MGYSSRNEKLPNSSDGDCQDGEPSNMRLSGRGDDEFVDEREGASAVRAYWYGGPWCDVLDKTLAQRCVPNIMIMLVSGLSRL
jgi:hypothetical protein